MGSAPKKTSFLALLIDYKVVPGPETYNLRKQLPQIRDYTFIRSKAVDIREARRARSALRN